MEMRELLRQHLVVVAMLLLLQVQVLVLGNAATATKLATARTINGTNFDGSGNITTSKWGTARTLALSGAVNGSASVDGSGNVTITTTQANIAILTGTISLSNGSGNVEVNYPSGYTKDNCVVIAVGMDIFTNTISYYSASTSHIFEVRLKGSKISVECESLDGVGSSTTKNYKVVLMKVS